MLARTFKSHSALGLKKKEYEALIKTMHMLERGEMKHVKSPKTVEMWTPDLSEPSIDAKAFNMGIAAQSLEEGHKRENKGCGTVACIGGWAAYYAGAKTVAEMEEYVSGNCTEKSNLKALFYPDYSSFAYSRITPKQAAQAIGNYLTTGEPNWEDILGNDTEGDDPY